MSQVYTFSQLGRYGALGNQLWQVAGVVGEAHKIEAAISFPEWDYAKYFNVPEDYFEEKDAIKIDFWPSYLQDMSHFKDIEVVIRDIFSPSDYSQYLLADRFPWDHEPGSIVGVHVRRGNNLTLPDHHPVCTLDYYEEALDHVNYKEILICSDDLDWCAKHSLFKDAHLGMGPPKDVNIFELTGAEPLTNEEAVIDLLMLAQCDSHVLSNSSFSWWAGWLGNGETTVYPLQWYGSALDHIDTSVMFPLYWTGV